MGMGREKRGPIMEIRIVGNPKEIAAQYEDGKEGYFNGFNEA